VTLLTFENGVRLNARRRFRSEPNSDDVRVGSVVTEPPTARPLVLHARPTRKAARQHSVDDLRRILPANSRAGFSADGDAFVVAARPTARPVLQMQLIAARITDPGFRPEAARRRQGDRSELSQLRTHAGGPLHARSPRLLASGDPRFGLPPKDECRAQLDEVKAG